MPQDIPKRYGGHRNHLTTPETTPLASGATAPLPQFIRLPKPGKRCYWTGLTRSGLNELVLGSSPKVNSVVVSRAGTCRGVRLIHLSSLLEHLHRSMDEQCAAGVDGKGGQDV